MKLVSIIDYGCGNILSIKRAVESLGFKAELTNNYEKILKSSSLILPGVGAFGNAMKLLEKKNLIEVIKQFALIGKKTNFGNLFRNAIITQKVLNLRARRIRFNTRRSSKIVIQR